MTTPFDIDFLHEQATKMTDGLDDFGDLDYREPLQILLNDYQEHSKLTDVGVQMLSGGAIGDLAGRLHEQAGFKKHAADLQKPITRACCITPGS